MSEQEASASFIPALISRVKVGDSVVRVAVTTQLHFAGCHGDAAIIGGWI